VLFLKRRDPGTAVLIFNTADATQNLDASSFNFDLNPGVDLSLARCLGGDNALEVRYFGIDQWRAVADTATTPDDLLQINAARPVFGFAGTAINADCTSELHNLEINGQHLAGDRLTWLVGFRYMELDEQFLATLANTPIPFTYETQTRNRLYGGQLGGKAVLWDRGGPWTIDSVGKAGIYSNLAAQDSTVPMGVVTVPASGKATSTSFVGEIAMTASCCLTEQLSLRGGYRLLWIDGVALATDQVAASDFFTNTGINASGDAFYHGAFLGLEYQR